MFGHYQMLETLPRGSADAKLALQRDCAGSEVGLVCVLLWHAPKKYFFTFFLRDHIFLLDAEWIKYVWNFNELSRVIQTYSTSLLLKTFVLTPTRSHFLFLTWEFCRLPEIAWGLYWLPNNILGTGAPSLSFYNLLQIKVALSVLSLHMFP